MRLLKDPKVYYASLKNLRLHAWGFEQIIRETFLVTVSQITCRPERWSARPQLAHGTHKWEGPTAQAVMDLVASDFEEVVTDWQTLPESMPATPSLRSATDIATGRRRA